MTKPPDTGPDDELLEDQRMANEHLVLTAAEAMESRDAAVAARSRAEAELTEGEARERAGERRIQHQETRHLSDMVEMQNANRLATLGKLTASIAHELGTPLAVIRARAQMIGCGDVPMNELDAEVKVILQQTDRMTQMVGEVLELARPKVAIKVPVDLTTLGRQCVSMLAPLTRRDRVTLELVDPGAPMMVLGDSSRLLQILTNLILNAKQSMEGAGVIVLSLGRQLASGPSLVEADYFTFAVTDQGSGIPPERLSQIFETFYTTKQAKEGTGLGLSVSKHIATQHGGFIGVTSELGRGSCFTLYLPPIASAIATVVA